MKTCRLDSTNQETILTTGRNLIMGNDHSEFDHEKRARELDQVHGSVTSRSILAAADFGADPLAEPLVPKTEKKKEDEKLEESEISKTGTIIEKEVDNEVAKEVKETSQVDSPQDAKNLTPKSTNTLNNDVSNLPETSKLILGDDVEPKEKTPSVALDNKTDNEVSNASAKNTAEAANKTGVDKETKQIENSSELTPVQPSGKSCLHYICCRK